MLYDLYEKISSVVWKNKNVNSDLVEKNTLNINENQTKTFKSVLVQNITNNDLKEINKIDNNCQVDLDKRKIAFLQKECLEKNDYIKELIEKNKQNTIQNKKMPMKKNLR